MKVLHLSFSELLADCMLSSVLKPNSELFKKDLYWSSNFRTFSDISLSLGSFVTVLFVHGFKTSCWQKKKREKPARLLKNIRIFHFFHSFIVIKTKLRSPINSLEFSSFDKLALLSKWNLIFQNLQSFTRFKSGKVHPAKCLHNMTFAWEFTFSCFVSLSDDDSILVKVSWFEAEISFSWQFFSKITIYGCILE